MSAIHQALRHTESRNVVIESPGFNPLTVHKEQKSSLSAFYLLGVALLLIAAGVFFWPSAASTDNNDVAGNNTAIVDAAINPATSNASSENLSTVKAIDNNLVETDADLSLAEPVQNLQEPVSREEIISEPAIAYNEQTDISPEPVTPQMPTASVTLPETVPAEPSAEQTAPSTVPTENRSTTAITPATTMESPPETTVSDLSIATLEAKTESNNSVASVITQSSNQWQQSIQSAIDNGNIEAAEAELKKWIGAAPDDSTPRIWLAKIYVNNGFFRAAEPLVLNVTDPEAKGLLGLVYERTARPALAAKTFESLYRGDPSSGKWLLFWAVNAENSGQLAKSLALYQNYLQIFTLDDANLVNFAEKRIRVIQGQ